MSGEKSLGDYLSGNTNLGYLDPQSSHINFAVPSMKIIRNFEGVISLPSELKPGIIEHSLNIKANSPISHMVSEHKFDNSISEKSSMGKLLVNKDNTASTCLHGPHE